MQQWIHAVNQFNDRSGKKTFSFISTRQLNIKEPSIILIKQLDSIR